MSAVTLKKKEVKIRKPHKCFGCRRVFEKGTIMIYCTSIYDDHFCSVYSCKTCDEIISHESNYNPKDWDDGFPEYFTEEWIESRGLKESPEQLLQSLKEAIEP